MGALGFNRVRMADPADEDRLYDFLQLLYSENAMFPIAEQKVRDMVRHATDRRGGIIGIIDGANGEIEASVGLVLEDWWYTRAVSLNERWNFVREDCRKTSHARQMIEFSKRCADELGVPLFMGIISTDRTEAKVRLYRRMLPYVGAFFMHGGKPPAHQESHDG